MTSVVLIMTLIAVGYCVPRIFTSKTPMQPAVYQRKLGTGFATNYFKTLDFSRYNRQNVVDIRAKGFRNLRLRCRADLDDLNMKTFLKNLKRVVDDCLDLDVYPVISWIHHEAEALATEAHREDYLNWWHDVAKKLKNTDYRLSFNLFTELGVDYCNQHNVSCDDALATNKNKYNNWTIEVINVIRSTGGRNAYRTIIVGSPKKTGKFLNKIDQGVYINDNYIMAEWHQYASGPNKKPGGQKYWEGDGTGISKQNVDEAFQYATNWTAQTGVLTYLGAWMPQDNKDGDINEMEALFFSEYFINQLKPIPWSLNVLNVYYDTSACSWRKEIQDIKGAQLNISKILDNIIIHMPPIDES